MATRDLESPRGKPSDARNLFRVILISTSLDPPDRPSRARESVRRRSRLASPRPSTDGGVTLSKAEARARVWREMEIRGVGRFPGTAGRIPNFVGAERAALQLQAPAIWREARAVKINPDAAQLAVRRMALREGKVVYMAVPRLTQPRVLPRAGPGPPGQAGAPGGLDPGRGAARPTGRHRGSATHRSHRVRGRRGERARRPRGEGRRLLGPRVRIAGRGRSGRARDADRHDGPSRADSPGGDRDRSPTTIAVDVVVTPDGVMTLRPAFPRPRGLYREALAPEKIAEVPVIGQVLRRGA